MKHTFHVNRWFLIAAVGLAVHLSAGLLLAQVPRPYTNIVVTAFDDGLSVANFSAGSGLAGSTILDWSTENAGGGEPGSGSMMVTIDYGVGGGGWRELQLAFSDPLPIIDSGGGDQSWYGRPMAPYYLVEYDMKVVSGDLGANNTYGSVQAILQGYPGRGLNGGGIWGTLGLVSLTPEYTDWQRITQVTTGREIVNLNAFLVNFVDNNTPLSNSITYLVDNIEIKLPSGPPPTLSLVEPATPGLHMIMGSGFQRQNIRTVGTDFAWVGAGGPVSYSLTINEYPSALVYSNFSSHIFLLPNATNAATSDPDWSQPTLVRVDIDNVDGTTNNPATAATMTFRYKTNAPASNGIFYDDGELATLESSQILGTWTVTFNSDTDVTLSAPDGSSTNFVFADASAFASDAFRVYFGIQAPEDASQEGQEVIFSGAQITGVGGGLSDDFLGASLDPSKWEKAAAISGNVFQVAPGPAYELTWMLPDNLFDLVVSTNLGAAVPWQGSTLFASVAGGVRSVVVPEGVPGDQEGYFALLNREPTKLLVLLPGETAAPGTPTGKTGTPTTQTVSNAFDVTVMTVDDDWFQAFSSDQVYLESAGDTNMTYGFQPQLIHGSFTYSVTHQAAGSHTLRVLDTSDTNIAEYVTGSYTVNP